MKGQQYIRFPKEVVRFMTRDYVSTNEVALPLFKELNEEEEAAFRRHARENHRPGGVIKEVYHPIWRDEARKMEEEWLEAGEIGQ